MFIFIEPTQFRLKLTQPNDLPTEYQRRLTHFGFPHYENYNGYKDDPDYNYVFDPYENGFTNSATTNAENTSENQNKMTMMDIGQPRPIATDTWTVMKDNGEKKVVTTVTEPVYVDFMQLYGLYWKVFGVYCKSNKLHLGIFKKAEDIQFTEIWKTTYKFWLGTT